MRFKTNALSIDELDIARAELDAFCLEPSNYMGQREFGGHVDVLQRFLDRAAMFDSCDGLYYEQYLTQWAQIRERRYDKTLDHSTHNLWPFVGKLEPRLARACINLAVGPKENATVVDPFCGSGTVLLEADLMGLNQLGGDIDPFAYWLSMMKLSLDVDEYAKAVKKLHKSSDSLNQQRAACPPKRASGTIDVCSATVLLNNLKAPVEAIVTSPPYFDALNYNDRHAEIRKRLELGQPKEFTLGVGQTAFEYGCQILTVSQAMAHALARRGRVVIVSAAYRGVDTPHLYESALRQSGLRLVTRLKRAYRFPTLGIGDDTILVLEKP